MIAFGFRFPAGRYHATPWGRHVNEADVAWPPEPVRILRALIATWWRKGDHAAFPKERLHDLVEALAAELPVYSLPDAVHSHIRAYMPAPSKDQPRLIYDGFLRLDRAVELIVAWRTVEPAPEQTALSAHLLERMGYLGRAESWVEARLVRSWEGTFNTAPRVGGVAPRSGTAPVDVMVPLTPADWTAERDRQAKSARPAKAKAKVHSPAHPLGLPTRLGDALAIDTSAWHEAGWPSPPLMRKVVYDRPEIGPLPPIRPRPARTVRTDPPGEPQVARYVLAGRPAPRIEDTLRVGEVLRLALMSRCGKSVPTELSGRDAEGRPSRDDPQHAHAFYLPEDADNDGEIDHLLVFSRVGFSAVAARALDGLTRLWVEPARSRGQEDGGNDEDGRKEWRVALEGIGRPEDFAHSPLLGCAREWISVTPYMKPLHDKRHQMASAGGVAAYGRQIAREWARRFGGAPPQAELDLETVRRSALHFARTRPRGRGGVQPDATGAFLRLRFAADTQGPIALGKHAHFGLGLFRRAVL